MPRRSRQSRSLVHPKIVEVTLVRRIEHDADREFER
jgi:hypothetical protein